MKLFDFKHKIQIRVRFSEVDCRRIVHNANYLIYFETGRIEYLKEIGENVKVYDNINEPDVVLVRNEINYRSSARFDDMLDIYTRVSTIKNTSFIFEGLIVKTKTREIIADNIAVHVVLDSKTGKPTQVKESFIVNVKRYEGRKLKILQNKSTK